MLAQVVKRLVSLWVLTKGTGGGSLRHSSLSCTATSVLCFLPFETPVGFGCAPAVLPGQIKRYCARRARPCVKEIEGGRQCA